MQRLTHGCLFSLLFGFPLACGSDANEGSSGGANRRDEGLFTNEEATPPASSSGPETRLKAASFAFPGAGTSQAARPLVAGLGPETSEACNPEPVAGSTATLEEIQTICFYGDSEDVPSAAIEQVVEVIGTEAWVHVRLTLNPDFVDNTYGANAVGWGDSGDGAQPSPPAPPSLPQRDANVPAAGDARPPDAGDAGSLPTRPSAAPPPGRSPGEARGPGRRGRSGHTFRDLVGSDHAEMQLLDGAGEAVLQFKLDYISGSDAAASGFESLDVSGGEGALLAGDEAMILASTTSLDRNLEACSLSNFVVDSPATDAAYTPNPAAPEWDYRVSYDVWVASDAFGSAGFGSALIELVHASPSKLEGDSVDVAPGPCPADPADPELAPAPLPEVLSNPR